MNDTTVNEREESLRELVVDAILHSYTIIYFSQRRWLGGALLAGTLFWPIPGLIGLGGLVVALAAAILMGFDRVLIRSGSYLFNSLLTSLALGHLYNLGQVSLPAALVLLVITSVLTLLVTVSLISLMSQTFGLPTLSLPFVIGQFVLFFMLPAAHVPVSVVGGADSWSLSSVAWQDYGRLYLQSFGSILFIPEVSFGLLAFVALLIYSRLFILHATVGMAVGMTVLSFLPLGITFAGAGQLAFNFMFCGMALGGVFFIPSRQTLMLVIVGSALCAVVAGAVMTVFAPLGFSPVALPFNLVVLLVLYAMKLRTATAQIHVTPFIPLSPEENFSKFHSGRARFPDVGFPAIHCPFMGERVVTQGVDGRMTHRRWWKYALDFEVLDEPNRRHLNGSRTLESYYTFNTPVLCPDDGTVAKTIDHVDDRPIGSNNFANNWGNLVIIKLDSGPFVKLCHLRQRSLTVKGGERVRRGQIIGYCGNSGRSPVPHLHVQLQTSPQVGAATIPFRLRHYFERADNRLTYRTAGVPNENARVEGATVEQRTAQCFDNIARRQFTYRVSWKGQEVLEKVTCGVDELGNYVFETPAGDRLVASVHDYSFFALEYQGGRNVLYWFWLGLSRVPFIAKSQAEWHDTIDLRPMVRPWAGLLLDLVGPFHRYLSIQSTGVLRQPENGARVYNAEACIETTFACEVPPSFVTSHSIPRRIRTYVSETDWVVAVLVDLDEPLLIEQV